MERSPSNRRSVFALSVQFFVNGLVYASYIPRLPEIRDRTGISIAMLGVVLAVGSMAGLVASFFTGRVLPRVGSRRILLIGGCAYVLALPGIGLAGSGTVLILALVSLAVFDVYVDVAMNYQGSVVSARRHAPIMSRLAGVWSVGTLVGGVTTAAAARADVPISAHFAVVATVVVMALLIAAPGAPTDGRATPQANTRRRRTTSEAARARSRGHALGAANLLVVTVDTTAGEWSSFRLADDLEADAGTAAAAFVVFTAAMAVGRLGGDHAVAGLGALVASRLGTGLAAIGLIAAGLTSSPIVTFLGIALTGAGISIVAPQLADAAARAPGAPGPGFTVLFVGHRIAGLATPTAVGVVAGTAASVGQAMAIVAVPCAGLLLLMLRPALRRLQPAGVDP